MSGSASSNRRRRIAVVHIFDFQTRIQAINELSTLLCKLSQYAMGDEALRSGDGAVRVICPSPSFEQYLDLACGEIRRRGAGETMISRALLRLLREVGSVVTTDKRRAYVLNQISLAVATAERSIQEPGDLTHFSRGGRVCRGLVDTVSARCRSRFRSRPAAWCVKTAPRDLGWTL